MKLALCLLFSSLAACATVQSTNVTPVPDSTSPNANRIGIYLGERQLDDDWDPVEDQPTFGLEYSRESPDSAVGFEVGIMGSSDDENDVDIGIGTPAKVEVSTGEIYAGIRKTFGEDVLRPYIGAGISFINLEADVDVNGPGGHVNDDDSSPAFYAHGGLAIAASEAFMVGLDFRVLAGSDMTVAGTDVDADYMQLALFLGIGF